MRKRLPYHLADGVSPDHEGAVSRVCPLIDTRVVSSSTETYSATLRVSVLVTLSGVQEGLGGKLICVFFH